TKFILSFAKVGLISDGGGLYFLPRLIGIHRAKELLFTAKPITAEEAKNLGIVNQIFTKERFREEVTAYATELAQGPTVAYGFIKKIANQSLTATLEDVLELERITQATVVTTNDHKEGVRAYKEKRGPQFSGK
ncbi:enoyl-CoA hydratase/isomerase family protein, partial [Bacillus cereus]|uniref:enoyl-CoA hydratase/isomerase family protein n=2 Tax=Bacillaceae TaxID=186817 RepID=UPI00366B7B5A